MEKPRRGRMKNRMLIFLLPFAVLAGCQNKEPKNVRFRGPVIRWVELTHKDTVTAGDSVILSYRFFNDGWSEGQLTRVENDGSVCKVDWPRQQFRVWDTGAVVLRCLFDEPGYHSQAIHVYHSGDSLSNHTAITYHLVVTDSTGKLPE
jgi:hypothetical protein